MKELLQAIADYMAAKKLTYRLMIVTDHNTMYCMYQSTFGGKQIDILSELKFNDVPKLEDVMVWVDKVIEKPYEYGV